jgi:hypothetical protein
MEQLDSYDTGLTTVALIEDEDKWLITCYDKHDIEQWSQEFDSLEEATRVFVELKHDEGTEETP